MPLDVAAKINWDKIQPKGMAITGPQSLLAPFLCLVCVWCVWVGVWVCGVARVCGVTCVVREARVSGLCVVWGVWCPSGV